MSAAQKPKASHPFMDREVLANLTSGVVQTLKAMAGLDAIFEKPHVSNNWKAPDEISVFLNLDTDPYKGQIFFHFNKNIAKTIIETMIGSPVDENSNDILDGVGEISNIFYGATKTKLNEMGFKLQIAAPHPYFTKDLPPRVGNAISMVIPFNINKAPCYIEIVIAT